MNTPAQRRRSAVAMARLRIAVRKSEARQAREADAAAVKNGSFVPTSRGLKLLHQETRDQV